MNIAIFASGSGSNAENIAKYFQNSDSNNISLIISNKPEAYVLERAKLLGIDALYMNKEKLNQESSMMAVLKFYKIEFIVLAGYLKLIPEFLIDNYPNKIINIHPALLPKFGGKGMYGMRVHETVVESKETETGITIHYVNSKYDEGNTIAQHKCVVLPTDTAQDVADKIHILEMDNFPKVIEELTLNLRTSL